MANVQRSFLTLFSRDLVTAKNWYIALLGYRAEFDSDWFVQLQSPDNSLMELGILHREHRLVPEAFRHKPVGTMLTLVVPDVDEVYRQVRLLGTPIVEEPTNQFYGQRRMLVTDPDGLLVDISSSCPPDADWLATL